MLVHYNFSKVFELFRMKSRGNFPHRSVIAEAMFNKIIKKMAAGGTPLDICIESASLGPAFAAHDPRVERLARESGLELPPRRGRCFDEVKDMVEYDLVLVMDKFDFEEVCCPPLPQTATCT